MALKIKNLILGEGRPKICVPITAVDETELLEQLEEIQKSCFDLLEWRADFFEEIENKESRKQAAELIRQRFPEISLLFTFRTKKEGGERELSEEAYEKLYDSILEARLADILDVELFAGEKTVKTVLERAKQKSVPVLLSNHDFEKTPPKEEMKERLLKMDRLGADILKIAVMPQTAEDILTLLSVCEEMKGLTKKPVVAISMGKLGLVSRLSGGVFGSAVTFGCAGKSSAPGQIEAEKLMEILELFE